MNGTEVWQNKEIDMVIAEKSWRVLEDSFHAILKEWSTLDLPLEIESEINGKNGL